MDPSAFINRIAPNAIGNRKQFGILASLTIAQAALETGWGSSVRGNNLFGIKGEGESRETREFVDGEWITVREGFRVYPSWEASVNDHGRFLSGNPRYRAVIGETDYRAAARALQAAGYATDPEYARKLISIIERWQLAGYDRHPAAYELHPEDAEKVIRFLSASWYAVDSEAAKQELHRLANEVRKAARIDLPPN